MWHYTSQLVHCQPKLTRARQINQTYQNYLSFATPGGSSSMKSFFGPVLAGSPMLHSPNLTKTRFILKRKLGTLQYLRAHGILQNSNPSIECVRCHAIKNKIKNYATDKVKKLWYCRQWNKNDSSPSLRYYVRRPKAEIFVEMFRTKLQSLVWSRHVGGPL